MSTIIAVNCHPLAEEIAADIDPGYRTIDFGLAPNRVSVFVQDIETVNAIQAALDEIRAALTPVAEHGAAVLTGGKVPAHVPGAYPSLSCCGGPVQLVAKD